MLRRTLAAVVLAGCVAAAVGMRGASAQEVSGVNGVGQMVVAEGLKKDGGFGWVRVKGGVQVRVGGVVKNVLFYGEDVVRVNANLGKAHTEQKSLVVLGLPGEAELVVTEDAGALTVASKVMRAVVEKKTGAVTFLRADGTVLTREKGELPAVKEVTISEAPTYEVKQAFTLAADEGLYGLGQYDKRYMDYRGERVLMVQTNIGIVVPFMMSTRRYGILWDVYSKSVFEDGAEGASFWAESAPAGVDYYVMAGADMDGVIGAYRRLTGAAPMMPKAAFGLFMSKERYPTQKRLVEVTRKFREEGFPLDYIVQDWQYWGSDKDGTWSGMTWNKERFPDPAGMTKTLHDELHVKVMASIWPSIGNDTDLAKELDEKGLRFGPLHWISKKARIYDAYSAEGRAIYFKHIKKGLLDVGIDALWMDGTEVEVGGACHNVVEVERDIKRLGKNAMGDFTRYLNPYSLVTTQGTYEGQRATSDKRVFTLTRSAWAGSQRYASVSWSGDTTSSWKTLRDQISGGVNVAMAGQPYWTQDTGGFFVNFPNGERNPEYRELYARWNQFGAFNPIYRIHGTSIEREPYIFKSMDPEMYKSMLTAAQLRMRLLPYVYGLGWKSTSAGYTMMRGLAMDFPDDQQVRKVDDAYMFGPAFLVHPVTRAMYRAGRPAAPAMPATAFKTLDGKPGIEVEYFEGTNFQKSVGKVVEAKVDYTWPGPPLQDMPAGLKSLNNFSARLEGVIVAPEEGEYEIGVEGDDGYRLFLDGKKEVEDWRAAAARYKGAMVTLKKGQEVRVKLEYYQGGNDRSLKLGWRTPSELAALAKAAPVENTMETYLPAGTAWYDFWTNEKLEGGKKVTRAVPLEEMPLYVRAGTVLPMGPVVQHVNEQPEGPLEIRVYPGTDAAFELYEDDGETYGYEKGQYAVVPVTWDEGKQVLTIGERKGAFAGMVTSRKMRVVWAGAGNGGVGRGEKGEVEVVYEGKAVEVKRPGR